MNSVCRYSSVCCVNKQMKHYVCNKTKSIKYLVNLFLILMQTIANGHTGFYLCIQYV